MNVRPTSATLAERLFNGELILFGKMHLELKAALPGSASETLSDPQTPIIKSSTAALVNPCSAIEKTLWAPWFMQTYFSVVRVEKRGALVARNHDINIACDIIHRWFGV